MTVIRRLADDGHVPNSKELSKESTVRQSANVRDDENELIPSLGAMASVDGISKKISLEKVGRLPTCPTI